MEAGSVKNKISVVLLILYVLFLMFMTGFKSAQLYLPFISSLEASLGGDKLMHFYLASLLAVLAWPVARLFNNKKYSPFLVLFFLFLILSICLLLDELHQTLISARYFDLSDTLYGMSGLVLGLLIRASVGKWAFGEQ